jgi:RND superfamily putative drug exporter
VTGVHGLVTGQPAIQHDLDPVFASDLRRGEAIALPMALLVLLAVLGVSWAVAIPFVVATSTIAVTLAAVYATAHEVSMVAYVTNLVGLIGLALAIDYSLLVVHRFREELARGGDIDAAVVRTISTAGRTVSASGLAVAAGLALLLLMPVPFIRSMGVGGLLIPLVSVAAALTLQPALLSLLGRRLARPARRDEGDWWGRAARTIMRRRTFFLVGGVSSLLVLSAPALKLHVTPGSFESIPAALPSARGLEMLSRGVGAGVVTPTQIVVDGDARAPATRAAIDRLVDELLRDPEVAVVASGKRPPYVAHGGRAARVIAAGRHEYGDSATRRFVDRLRTRLIPAARFPPDVHVYTGGAPPQGVDFLGRAYGAFPWVAAAVLALTAGILLRAFRSVLLPLKAVVLNLLTVAAAFGVLELVFREPVEAWVPIFLFATLFGLSMDYEVFLVMRMREAWERGRDNEIAVAHGLERTGRVVTAAAAIMIAAFSGFVAGRVPGLRQFGVGLAFAVLLDATLVRVVLVPSLMAVLGRWNWWLPGKA